MENTGNFNAAENATLSSDFLERLIKAEVELALAKKETEHQLELVELEQKYKDSNQEKWGEFYEALAKAQAAFDTPKKSKTATVKTQKGYEYTYDYATLSDILGATEQYLNENGIFFSQNELTKSAANGDVFVAIETTLSYKNGLTLKKETLPLKYNPFNAQDARSIVSYLRRYGASNILGIEPEDGGDDANIAQGNDFHVHNSYPKAHQQNQNIPHKPSGRGTGYNSNTQGRGYSCQGGYQDNHSYQGNSRNVSNNQGNNANQANRTNQGQNGTYSVCSFNNTQAPQETKRSNNHAQQSRQSSVNKSAQQAKSNQAGMASQKSDEVSEAAREAVAKANELKAKKEAEKKVQLAKATEQETAKAKRDEALAKAAEKLDANLKNAPESISKAPSDVAAKEDTKAVNPDINKTNVSAKETQGKVDVKENKFISQAATNAMETSVEAKVDNHAQDKSQEAKVAEEKTSQEGQLHETHPVMDEKPKAATQRSVDEIFVKGLKAAEILNASEDQIHAWENMADKTAAIKEIVDFCNAAQAEKMTTGQL
ncbi:ERF family protein [Streptococcus hyointestinalis]